MRTAMEVTEYILPIRNLVDEAQNIHLFLADNHSLDGIATVLAWRNILSLRDKNVLPATPRLDPNQFANLPNVEAIQVPLPQPEMRIAVDLRPAEVTRVNYETVNHTLTFHLYPQNRPLSPEQVRIEQSQIGSDLIFTFGFHNDEQLRAYTAQNLVNIDINAENTRFGKINLVDPNSASLAELSSRLFSELNWPLEAETATLLLGGIISSTRSFRQSVSAQTFTTAAQLTQAGADVTLASELGKGTQLKAEPNRSPSAKATGD